MAEFKASNLIRRLEDEDTLSQNAWDFIDACTDDWCVDEYTDDDGQTMYELRYILSGAHNGITAYIVQVNYANIFGICALIEHLALVSELLMERSGLGADLG